MRIDKLVYINIVTFLVFSNVAFFYLYPLYLADLEVSQTSIGLIMGIYSVASFIARPFVGKVIVWIGEKPVLVFGLVLIFICSLLYHMVPGTVWEIYVLRTFHGVGFSAFIAAAFSTIAKFAPAHTKGRAFSYNSATMLAALGSVPLIGEYLMDKFDYPAIFHGGAAVTFLGFSLLVFTTKWEKIGSEHTSKIGYGDIIRNRSFIFVLIAMIVFINAQATVLTYFPLYASTIGIGAGLFLGAAFGLAIALRIFGAGILDKYRKLVIIRVCFVLVGIGLMLFQKLDIGGFYMISILLYGTGLGYIFPALNALGAEQGTLAQKAGMMSLLTMIIDGGFILGTVFSGGLSDMIGLSNTFLFAGGVSLLGFFVTAFAPIREEKSL
jgi:predicted MFS family arabinose efflux permease